MKRPTFILAVFLLAAGAVWAQAPKPAGPVELAMGFDWARTSWPFGHCRCYSLTGLHESLAVDLTPNWAVLAEAGDVRQPHVYGSSIGVNFSRFLAGGRYRWRPQDRISFFAQFMDGVLHIRDSFGRQWAGLAVQPGAGVDIALSPHLAFRPVEIDYLHASFQPSHFQPSVDSFRYSASLVFRFGLPR